jgi:hypothetical protein
VPETTKLSAVELALPEAVRVPVIEASGSAELQLAVRDRVPWLLPLGARVTEALELAPELISTVVEPEDTTLLEESRPLTVKVQLPAASSVKVKEPSVEVAETLEGPVPAALYFVMKLKLAGTMVRAELEVPRLREPEPADLLKGLTHEASIAAAQSRNKAILFIGGLLT